MIRYLILVSILLSACKTQEQALKSGLLIENAPNRGLNFTDSLGNKFNYRNIPITISNDSVVPIQIQIELSKEYNLHPDSDEIFRVFVLPVELTPDKISWDSVSYEIETKELRNFFDRGLSQESIFNETLEPGEETIITIGTLYPRPPKNRGVLPNELFVHDEKGKFTNCLWKLKDNPALISNTNGNRFALGLKLMTGENCIVIPCGEISYPEQ